MKISYRWLGDLIPGLSLSPQEVADRLAMLGAPVDDVVDIGGPLRDVVIARVEHAGRHPNADRLSLCTVDAGAGHTLQVVCGAPNVRSGGYYPFAPVGATLPGGVTIRRAKIRGEESQGMLCSPRELGLGRDHEGIMELHGEFEPGRSFIETLGMDDARLELDVTPNRPDLLSHLGVARELAAATGLEARLHELSGAPQVAVDGWHDAPATAGGVTVRVEDAALCSRYYGLVIRGVSVGPSPEWLAARLRAIGLRPINNVVDATNHVLQELGQPLHAFDLARLGSEVVVRPARAGERIVTLDDVDRALAQGMLVIADATRPVAVAGVMGGADTEVDATTRDVLLECAHFDPRSIRATRSALGLSTDASYRFERGVDPEGLVEALRRVATLIVAVAGGRIQAVPAAAGPGLPAPPPVRLRLGRVRQVLGESIDGDRVAALLRPLGFTVRAQTEGSLDVDVPGHRRYDVAREEDLIEDIARHYGYDAFPDELRPFRPSSVPDHPLFHVEDRLRTLLVARGFLEARTAAFAPAPLGDVALLHPLSATEGRLRRALLPGLVRRIEYNFARGASSIRLFELGTSFAPGAAGAVPAEETRLAVAFTGLRRPAHWSEPDAPCDVWDLKALLEEIAAELGLNVEAGAESSLVEEAAGNLGLRPARGAEATPLEPALAFRLLGADGAARGAAGRVLPSYVDAPAWAHAVWGIEVALAERHVPAFVRHRPLPSFPSVERDLALLLPDALASARVVEAVRSSAGALLEGVEPFDLYRGAGVPDGARSVAYRLRFRATDRTLTDAEVDAAVQRTLQHLDRELGVQQRA